MTATEVRAPSATSSRLGWIDSIKGVAIVWIFLNHVAEALFGGPLLQNPSADWPSLGDRVAQLAPLGDVPSDVLRYVGWIGDQGVGLFLLCTGLVLAYALTRSDGSLRPLETTRWWSARFSRLMPVYWVLLGILLLPFPFSLIDGLGVSIADSQFWFSVVGLRPPGALYYGVPAFWYVSLLVQLYLVFPLIWHAARRVGLVPAAVALIAASLVVRVAGLLVAGDLLDYWARGGLVVARLPEVMTGVLLGYAFARDRVGTGERLRRPRWVIGGALMWLSGTVLGITLVGVGLTPVLAALGVFLLLHALFTAQRTQGRSDATGVLAWTGRHSLSIFLVHQVWVLLLLYPVDTLGPAISLRIVAVVVLTVVSALGLERVTRSLTDRHRSLATQRRGAGVSFVALLVALPVATGLGLEAATRTWAPQEVNGWGERASLAPSDDFGWTREANTDARLRWLGYDYLAPADAEGFPGYGPGGDELTPWSVLVLGDAFSSPEGVEPEEGWPRLLEAALWPEVSVYNAATTGYGPDQNARVAEALIPRLRPDVVLVQMFVNDFDDVTRTDSQFMESIGFGRPAGDSFDAWLRWANTSQWLQLVTGELRARLLSVPSPSGRAYGQLEALERGGISEYERAAVSDRLARIVTAADAVGARIDVIMVPSAAQVCDPTSFHYTLGGIDLSDSRRWDADGPQRLARLAATAAGVDGFLDLRAPLRGADRCPYHPANMHWLPLGHARVAEAVAASTVDRLQAASSPVSSPSSELSGTAERQR